CAGALTLARPAGCGVGRAEKAPVRAPSPAIRVSKRVLVVDDNRDSAESLAMMLTMTGNEVRTAWDGEGGLEAAAAFRPDVAFLDIGMPRLDGHECARRIRSEAWG